jgi:hypothetical protein
MKEHILKSPRNLRGSSSQILFLLALDVLPVDNGPL